MVVVVTTLWRWRQQCWGGDDDCDVDGNDVCGNDGGDERLVVEVVSDSSHFVFQRRKCMQEIFKINECYKN